MYPGKASQVAPNLIRELDPESLTEVVFSDIFECRLADGTKLRGCFTLWKRLGIFWVWPSSITCEPS